MELKDIASVAGKSGLYKVVKPTRTGVILETLDAAKKKLIVGANARVSLLKEISIYTTGAESSIMLEDVFDTIYAKYAKDLTISHKGNESELQQFIQDVVPNYDEDRVYMSDIKKLISWYKIMIAQLPELFEAKEEVKEAPKKKPAAKKAQKKAASK